MNRYTTVTHEFNQLLKFGVVGGTTDSQLIEQFARQDEAADAAFEALPPAEQAEVIEEAQKVTDAANDLAERTNKRRISVMASCSKHAIKDGTRHAITKALFGVESSKGLTFAQLYTLRGELEAYVEAKVTDDPSEVAAWCQYRGDLRAEAAGTA